MNTLVFVGLAFTVAYAAVRVTLCAFFTLLARIVDRATNGRAS